MVGSVMVIMTAAAAAAAAAAADVEMLSSSALGNLAAARLRPDINETHAKRMWAECRSQVWKYAFAKLKAGVIHVLNFAF